MPVPIVAAVRSPFAMADGVLAGWHPVDLSVVVAQAALDAAGLDAGAIDHVWVGCDEPVGAQGANMARAIVLAAGWPETVGGTVVESAPHSGFSALAAAADAVAAGRVETAMVIGVASSSIVQPGASALGRLYGRPWGDAPAARFADEGGLLPPIVAADRAALVAGIDRVDQDRWGLASIERRGPAPHGAIVTVGARPGDSVAVQKDTPVSADAIRSIPVDELEPIFDEDGTTTAATYAPAADGVSVLVLGRGEPIGEITGVDTVAGPIVGVPAIPPSPVGQVDVAASSASIALLGVQAMSTASADADRNGGTIATGDAAAAEDLRLVVDGLHRAEAGATGHGVRFGVGAAAGCLWRRL